MKYFLLPLFCCICIFTKAQLFGPENIITTNTDGPTSVGAHDLDNDGDLDILISSDWDHKVFWMENDGNGNFITEHVISLNVTRAFSADASDLDDDGDLDVISASFEDGILAWHENLGGGVFSSEIVIDSGGSGANWIVAFDLDNDGDMDVLASSAPNNLSGIAAWYENDGSGNFSDANVIESNVLGISAIHASDLDNDGDLDVITSSNSGSAKTVSWYENDGNAMFSGANILYSSPVAGTGSAYTEDLDLDGDQDIIVCSVFLEMIENLGGGTFEQPVTISNSLAPKDVDTFDLDEDGDLDLFICSLLDDIQWIENLGGLDFETHQVNSDDLIGAFSPEIADIDLDGDADIIAAINSGDKVISHFNLTNDGCIDPLACNYDQDAQIEDGSCCYTSCGCTNNLADNYNPEAICDDHSCVFTISGFVFNDENENGTYDGNDFGLAFQTVNIEPIGMTVITNDQGEFYFEWQETSEVEFSVEFNPIFPFNTTEHPVSFDPEVAMNGYIEFGISKEEFFYAICVDLYPSGNTFLCNDWSNHNICYRNMGNVTIDGIVELEYDPLFQAHAEVTSIDSTNGNIVYMSFENLQPGQMFFYDVDLLTPTVDYIGEVLTSYARVTGFSEGEQVAYGEQILETEVACAYDPNDKQAFPLGYTDEHWLLQQTEQEFLIRFQNTGNASAQNIRIQDTLDVNFDIESFKLMANSHSVMTTIDPETRLIDFYFENIQLPDSVNNEPDSHGLVSYKITPLPDLPIGTLLENTAYIYFDNNEPIITNTTWTTIHECGGESSYSTEEVSWCQGEGGFIEFSADYPFIESTQWWQDEEVVSSEESHGILVSEPSEIEITLQVSNPLCEETTTFVYEVVDIELFDPCIADYTCDGLRNSEDLMSFLTDYGCIGECEKDLNGNGLVNAEDLMVFLSFFGRDCWE